MTHPTNNSVYTVANGTTSTAPFIEVFKNRAPTPNDVNYLIQQRWWDTASNAEYILIGFTSTGGELQAIWALISFSGTAVESLRGNTGPVVFPQAGNINVVGDGSIISINGDNVTATLTASLVGIVPPANGGTGVSNPTGHGVAIGEGAAPFNFIPLTSGQVLIGSTGIDPVPNTLTAGTGITISNGPGTIMISSSATGITWNLQSTNLANLVKNNGYICVSPGGALTLGLPIFGTSTLGDMFQVVLNGATSFQITQNANQQIILGSQSSTVGVGGSITSTANGDLLSIIFQSNVGGVEEFVVLNSQGNLTIV